MSKRVARTDTRGMVEVKRKEGGEQRLREE